ncbi:MAG: glutathione S-transferase C-terminal domain-containing protein, partial [Rhodospirillales bacterium]|nr:glutathione S-transferase C-terminal domain-containing protein [Rhodospirillales bacterium]
FPPAGGARWTALRRQALADGIIDAAVLRLLESRRPAELQSQPWTDRQVAVVDRGLDALEDEADSLGDTITIGHIAIACALGYLDFRYPDDGWRDGRPMLSRWFEAMSARRSVHETVPYDPN